jgi:hypothetical protein
MLHKTQRLLSFLRPVQFIILVVIIILEIIQLVGFSKDRIVSESGNDVFIFPNQLDKAPLSNTEVPWSAYFEDMNVVHGVKIFYFIVILLTLISPQFFWKRFSRAPILSRDKYYEFLGVSLWMSVCFTNLNPAYSGTNLNCDDPEWRDQGYRCKAFLSSLFFSFVMAGTWVITTIVLLSYINIHKDELADKQAEKKQRRKENRSRDTKSSAEIDKENDLVVKEGDENA